MPLTRLDETLRHQIPTTFDHVGTSDPRFFDRYWFSCYDPAGSLTMIIGVGLYMNMNVFDGFVACPVPRDDGGGNQRNFRFSRALRRIAQDYRRYTQVGRMDGTVTLDDTGYDLGLNDDVRPW